MAAPTINITLDKAALKLGETATATFTFSAAPVGFTLGDVTVTNGTLSGLAATPDPLVYEAIFSPSGGLNGASAELSVAAGAYADTLGNLGLAGISPAISLDTQAPSVSISSSASQLRSGETATITLTFSEAVAGFSLSDMSAVGGTLSGLSATGDPLIYTATFAPNGGLSGLLGSVSLSANSYTDVIGNDGGGGSSSAIVINTLGPSVLITSSEAALKAGESALLTFTFSSPPTGFSVADISFSGGAVSGLSNMGGGVYEATFTPSLGVAAGVGNVSVASGSYTDSFGNQGGGASLAPMSIDTLRPTASIAVADPNIGIGQTSLVTFTFSEAVTGFTNADLTFDNGTLSAVSSSDGGVTWSATLTPTAGITDTINVITVDLTGVADLGGNVGSGTVDSPNYILDSQRPTATIVMSDTELKAGQTSTVTVTFSEAVAGFTNDDVTVANGTLSTLSSADGGITWTATFTPNLGVDNTTNLIVVNNVGYTDLAGNAGTGVTNSANYVIDTIVPTATIVVADAALKAGETSHVTFTFSEAVTGFTIADLMVANGVISNLSSGDGGVTWTAMLAPTANMTDASNVIELDQTGVVNARGNSGVGTVGSNNYEIDTALPTATILVANAQMQAGQTSLVTITFSESVVGFDLSDLSVANGVLSSLVSVDGGKTWTATLTPTAGITDATNLIVLETSGVTDAAGNTGASIAISNNYKVGHVPPTQVSDDDVIVLPAAGGEVAAGPGDDSVSGSAGADFIQGNTGADTLSGGGGDDIVRGGQDNDFVHGNAGADMLFGDLGNDSVFGGQGDDFVQGGAGNDYVLGDLGRDTVLGGQGADAVFGGAGDDYLSGDLGDDVLVGGAGADIFNFTAGGGRDVVMDFSRAEGDRIRLSTTDAADFAALTSKLVADGANTIIQLDGQTIVLAGVAKSALSAADFVFG